MAEPPMNGTFMELLNSVGQAGPVHLNGLAPPRETTVGKELAAPDDTSDVAKSCSYGLETIDEDESSFFSGSRTKGSRCFSSFDKSIVGATDDDVSSADSSTKHYGCIEESLREFCVDRSKQLFKPTIGMEFESSDEAYQYFNMYSWVMGFSIRCGDNFVGKNGKCRMKEFCCQRQGFARNAKHATTRCGCKAMIRILLNDKMVWYVKVFVEEHNHPLVESCGEKKHLFSHKHIDKHTKDLVRHLRENNVSLSRVNLIMGSIYGSMGNVPFTKKSLRTICSEIARDSLEDDVRKTLEKFHEMIASDPKFVFTAQVDTDDRLRSLMWTSGRSRSLYKHFGDVVTFDTTYETNIYKMPFGMFVGVNNHFQSVIYAGVLLTNETAEDFKWAFEEFVSMMGGKAPITMLTDQCLAMTIAIRESLKSTHHRWCKWHVLRKAKEVLCHVYKGNPTFAGDFNKLINHMLTPKELEDAWESLVVKYGLGKHPFMIRAYECRNKWAKPYFTNIFCARMTSTQRSESANHVLKIYVPAKSSINKFVTQYSRLIEDRESADNEAQKNMHQKAVKTVYGYPIEKHAAELYTAAVYVKFKEELLKSTNYVVMRNHDDISFEVEHVEAAERESWSRVLFVVDIVSPDGYHRCDCGLFEHFGVICCHIITVMLHKGVLMIPPCHIVKRWTKAAREQGPTVADDGQMNIQMSRAVRHKLLHLASIELNSIADYDDNTFRLAMKGMENSKNDIRAYKRTVSRTCQVGYKTTQQDLSGESGSAESSSIPGPELQIFDAEKNTGIAVSSIKAPVISKKIGRPTNKRFMSHFDATIKKGKKRKVDVEKNSVPGGRSGVKQTRFCSVCHSPDHDIRKCPAKELMLK